MIDLVWILCRLFGRLLLSHCHCLVKGIVDEEEGVLLRVVYLEVEGICIVIVVVVVVVVLVLVVVDIEVVVVVVDIEVLDVVVDIVLVVMSIVVAMIGIVEVDDICKHHVVLVVSVEGLKTLTPIILVMIIHLNTISLSYDDCIVLVIVVTVVGTVLVVASE